MGRGRGFFIEGTDAHVTGALERAFLLVEQNYKAKKLSLRGTSAGGSVSLAEELVRFSIFGVVCGFFSLLGCSRGGVRNRLFLWWGFV